MLTTSIFQTPMNRWGLRTRHINPNNPIGEVGNTLDEISNGVLGGLDYDPQAARHDLFKAAYLIGASYDSFTNQCARETEDKKARKRTQGLAFLAAA